MNFELTEELAMLQQAAREFAETELREESRKMDREESFNKDVFKKMADLGLTGLTIPEQYGGAGLYDSNLGNQAASVVLE
ncbi:MAG: acyl-CoA dehydrogenase family protein, partial [Planctomycetota bacterium]